MSSSRQGVATAPSSTGNVSDKPADKTPLLVVGHEADRSGATLFLLDVVARLAAQPHFDVGVALAEDGPVTADFHRLCPTKVTPRAEEAGRSFWHSLPRVVLAHSVVSHTALQAWPDRDTALVSYIQELDSEIARSGAPVMMDGFRDQTFIAGAECVRDMLVERFEVPQAKVRVVRNGIPPVESWAPLRDRSALRDELGVPPDAVLFMGSGPVCWRKGTDLFFHAAAQLHSALGTDTPARFVWFGRQDEPFTRQLRQDIESFGLSEIVTLLPPSSTPRDLFHAADVYLLTSREEPFSRALLEVLALGVPAIAFRQGGVPELAAADEGLHVVPYADTSAMARVAQTLLDGARRRRDQSAARRIAARHTLSQALEDTELVIAETVRKAPPPGRQNGRPRDSGRVLARLGGRPVRPEPLIFGRPQVLEEDVAAVAATMRSGWIGKGPRVEEFETAFARYIGCRNAVAVSSCTSALHLALLAAGARPGTEVVTTSVTYPATVNAIVQTGATAVLADVDPATRAATVDDLMDRVTDRTIAVVPMTMAGYPFETARLMARCQSSGIAVVEDAAHCVEGWSRGSKVGAIADATCFSFYPTKNLTAIDGGMVTTPHDDWAASIRLRANQGVDVDAWRRATAPQHYAMLDSGIKANLTDVHAALGLSQLARLEENLSRRRKLWSLYTEGLAGLPLDLPALPPAEHGVHAMHLYTVLVRPEQLTVDRDEVLASLRAENIGCGVHYAALHLQPYFSRLGMRPEDLPRARVVSERVLSLPFSPALTDADAHDVIAAVNKVLLHYTT